MEDKKNMVILFTNIFEDCYVNNRNITCRLNKPFLNVPMMHFGLFYGFSLRLVYFEYFKL